MLSILLPDYFNKHNCSTELLEALWKVNPDLFIRSLSLICVTEKGSETSSNISLSKVLDITQSIKNSLLRLTNSNEYSFSIALGMLAAKRDFLH